MKMHLREEDSLQDGHLLKGRIEEGTSKTHRGAHRARVQRQPFEKPCYWQLQKCKAIDQYRKSLGGRRNWLGLRGLGTSKKKVLFWTRRAESTGTKRGAPGNTDERWF